jgi:hypothetical protein
MKVTNNFVLDALIHIFILIIINIYIVSVSSFTEINDIIIISIIFGLIITYINYMYFPRLELNRVLKNIQK